MKKILALLSSLALMTTAGFSVVACNNEDSIANLKKINEVKNQIRILVERLVVINNSITRIETAIESTYDPDLLKELNLRLAEARQSQASIAIELNILGSQWVVLEIDNANLTYNFGCYDNADTIRARIIETVDFILQTVANHNKYFYYDMNNFSIRYTWEFSANVYGFAYSYNGLNSTQVITIRV